MGLILLKRINENGKHKHISYIINSIDDYVKLLNDHVTSSYKYIGIPNDAKEYIELLISKNEEIKLRKFTNNLRRFFYFAKFSSKLEFWLNRGYSTEEARVKVANEQSKNGNKYGEKRRKNPDKYYASNNKRVEYWIKKGLSETEAISKISDLQRRDLNYYQTKYGNEIGSYKMIEKNKKWLESRELSKNITWKTSDQSLSFIKSEDRYGKHWLSNKIQNTKNLQLKELLLQIEKLHFEDNNLLNYILDLDFEDALIYSNNSVVQYLLKDTHIQLKSKWMIKNNVTTYKTKKWGCCYYINDKYYQSTGEFIIGTFLEKNNIKFELHKRYMGLNRISDFYICDSDLYIEYTGMTNDSYKNKKKQLVKTPYKILWSSDYNEIIKYIDEKICRK